MGNEYNDFDMFRHDLTKLVNKYGLEDVANIPDYVIAAYLTNCFVALNKSLIDRDNFFNMDVWRDSNIWGSRHDDY